MNTVLRHHAIRLAAGLGLIWAIIAGVPVQAQTVALTADEQAALLYLREEEKLARDVYLGLYDTWQKRVFSNIARSEQNHMDAVKLLLDHYAVPDPVAANGVGVFTSPDLQALYDTLLTRGRTSAGEAIAVGILIEQKEIGDLQAFLSRTDKFDLQTVYNNLLDGSESHLAAFTSQPIISQPGRGAR